MEPMVNQQVNSNPYTPGQPVYSAPQPQPTASVKTKRTFSGIESVYAWLSLLFGYLFCRIVPLSESPLGGFIFVVSLFITGFVVLKIMKKKIPLMPLTIALSAVIISLSLILTSNNFLHFFSYLYSLAVFGYFIYSVCGNRIKNGFTDLIVADFFKALIIMPFCSFGYMFRAMFTGKGKCKGRIFLKILIGAAIAIIPTMIVFGLLSYDSDFTGLLNNIFDFDFDEIWSHLGSLILGVPLGFYGYGLFISSVDNKCSNVITEKGSAKAMHKIRIAPVATILAAVAPLLFLYVVFFISQWKYYVSGFTGILPESFSYATYAREGFFQLCAVAVVNLIIIIAVILFLKRNNKVSKTLLKATVLTFSLATLILISTAVAKMIMYINTYGLTPKRVYSTWFMLVIALIFIFISLKMFVRKLKVVALSLVITVLMFMFICVPDVDAFIAKYNAERYINGTLETVDLDAMKDLGSSSIPALVDLKLYLNENSTTEYESQLNKEIYEHLTDTVYDYKYSYRNIFSYTIPDLIAKSELKDIGYY